MNGEARNSSRSPTRALFTQNKETLEQMLARKLREKYVDDNAAFREAGLLPTDSTARLL